MSRRRSSVLSPDRKQQQQQQRHNKQQEYQEFLQLTKRVRKYAVLLWQCGSAVLAVWVMHLKLGWSIEALLPWLAVFRHPVSIVHLFLFAWLQWLLCVLRLRVRQLHVHPRSLLGAAYSYSTNINTLPLVVVYPLIVLACTWILLDLRGAVDARHACVFVGMPILAHVLLFRSVYQDEFRIRFPDLQQARAVHLKKRIFRTLYVSMQTAVCFTVVFGVIAYVMTAVTGVSVSSVFAGLLGHHHHHAPPSSPISPSSSSSSSSSSASSSSSSSDDVIATATTAVIKATCSTVSLFCPQVSLVFFQFAWLFAFLWNWCRVLIDVLFSEEVDFGSFVLLAIADRESRLTRYWAFLHLMRVAEFRPLPLTELLNAASSYFVFPKAWVYGVPQTTITNHLVDRNRDVRGSEFGSQGVIHRRRHYEDDGSRSVDGTALLSRSHLDASRTGALDNSNTQPTQPQLQQHGAAFNAKFAVLYGLDDTQAWKWVVLPACVIMDEFTERIYLCLETADAYRPVWRGMWSLRGKDEVALVFHDSQLLIWVVQSISLLASRSFEEDLTGIVQETLHDIVMAMLDLCVAIDEFVKSGVFVDDLHALLGHQLARPECTTLSNHLDNALYRLGKVFDRPFQLILRQLQQGSPHHQRLLMYVQR